MNDEHRQEVLDHGYVRIPYDSEQERYLVLGSDLSIVNAARASYSKESTEFSKNDERLLKFLWDAKEDSPFRHALVTFEVKAPLMVARQWWKYIVGSDHSMDAWNEASRRYLSLEPEYYTPSATEWRSQPDSKKQGSGGPIDGVDAKRHSIKLEARQALSIKDYMDAMEQDYVCAEQARLYLLAYGLYVSWRWTGSISSVCHMLRQRLAHDAQKEFQFYAEATHKLIRPFFPVTVDALTKEIYNEQG